MQKRRISDENSRLSLVDYIETDNNISPTLTTRADTLGVIVRNYKLGLRLRKYTPLECFRLMGVKDDDYSKLRSELSNSQRYCLAGNSIVVNVLMAIFNTIL